MTDDRMEWGTGIDIRCPACDKFATVGKKHDCPKGRNRDPFVDPLYERNGKNYR
jgi:hypothetical protein